MKRMRPKEGIPIRIKYKSSDIHKFRIEAIAPYFRLKTRILQLYKAAFVFLNFLNEQDVGTLCGMGIKNFSTKHF